MKRLGMVLMVVTGILALAACGSSSSSPVADTGKDLADLPVLDLPGEGTDTVPVDPGQADNPVVDPGTDPGTDPGVDTSDVPGDNTPPTVTKTEPAADAQDVATPFVIKVTFSEAIRFKDTVDANTFYVRDINDQNIKGTFTYDEKTFTVTFTPKDPTKLTLAMPYKVTLKNLIQDIAGNKMKDFFVFRFSTALPANLKPYEDLAAKYSPILYQATDPAAPQFDYLAGFDFDGDFKAMNNDANIKKAAEVKSFVYWDVVETKSHFFIRYGYFYPRHPGVKNGEDAFENDLSGATVVVARYPQETPVAVEMYFNTGTTEEVRSFVTSESGIKADGDKLEVKLPADQLFPSGHYLGYLSSKSHESCSWVYESTNPADFRCKLNAGIKDGLKIVRYVYSDGTADALKAEAGSFPAAKDPVSYGLKSWLKEWWVRRDLVGEDQMYDGTFKYESPEGGLGNGTVLPRTFLDSVAPASTYKGHPPWSWKWAPNGGFVDLPMGTYFMDPAYFFAKRHFITPDFNADAKTGYSTEYCFNQFLKVDHRGIDPLCSK